MNSELHHEPCEARRVLCEHEDAIRIGPFREKQADRVRRSPQKGARLR